MNLFINLRHQAPVWQVAWAHPKFGNILASCSYDGKVFIWREGSPTGSTQWVKIKEYTGHTASVNSVAWAPHEYGLILAAGSSDGKISILSWKTDGTWDINVFAAHGTGVNTVSWAPSTVPGSLIQLSNGSPVSNVLRFVSGGCDNIVKVWILSENTWKEEFVLEGHSDWVRDVSWAPTIGLPLSYIASCSQDRTVLIWTQEKEGAPWTKKKIGAEDFTFSDVVWRVSWSTSGTVLAVSSGDNKVTLWKENLDGVFEQVGDVTQ